MVKVDHFFVINKDDKEESYEMYHSDPEEYFEFLSDYDRVAFEEKIETAFCQCVGCGFEVVSVGRKRGG
jgi:hypothetical protein